jgi:5-amino-6-(5-phosphoribosylamino)uracil reductase
MMAGRPYVLLSAAMSADGCIDDASDQRLVLSDAADLDRVDEVRAGCDAILVGAQTIRRDNPGLRIRSAERERERLARGWPARPARVTITGGGGLDPAARFFADDGIARLVYAPDGAVAGVRARLGAAAEVIGCGDPLSLPGLLADLAGRGVARLMVEGGSRVLAQFLAAGLADELQLAIAPVLVGDPAAPRLLTPGGPAAAAAGTAVPWPRQLELAGVSRAGRMAVLRYERKQPESG